MQIRDKQGNAQEIQISLEDYKAALSNKLSFKQYMNQKFAADTDVAAYGEPYAQMMMSSGLFMKPVLERGIRPPTVQQILESNNFEVSAGPYVRNDGSQALTVTGRLFFVSTLFEIIESALVKDDSSFVGMFNRMIATTRSVDTPYIVQPTITSTGPRDDEMQPIAQLAQPTTMTSISTAYKTYRMPEFSIGLEISHQAQQAMTIDLVGIILRRQAEGQRVRWAMQGLKKILSGDKDWGMEALPPAGRFSTFDSSITTAGKMTHKAWIKWLRDKRYYMTLDWVVCDLDTFLAIQNRADRPMALYNTGNTEFMNTVPNLVDPGIPMTVNFLDVPNSILPANTLVGLDSRHAIQKFVFAGAAYEAVEEYVMRRSTAMRFDVSEAYTRIYDDAFYPMTLTV